MSRTKNPLVAQLREMGVSGPYASQLASGQRRPSLRLALRIFDALGVKLGQLAGKTDAEIATLRRASSILSDDQDAIVSRPSDVAGANGFHDA
jgi:transcriptional regulator with XRE-family HTH domain